MENNVRNKKSLVYANTVLMVLLAFTVFGVMFLPRPWFKFAYNLCYSGILTATLFCLQSKFLRYLRWFAMAAILFQWSYFFINVPLFNGTTKTLNAIFFITIVINLVRQAAISQNVTALVIMQAINGYLLIGIFFSFLVGLIVLFNPNAYSFHSTSTDLSALGTRLQEYIYFVFITLTTVGYGDVVPTTPPAQSLAIFIGLTGQLYITIIIAMLVGKFAAYSSKH